MKIVVGECNHCGVCCITNPIRGVRCGYCYQKDGKWLCRLHPDKPEGCKRFPTVEDFLRGKVPKECGYKLIEVKQDVK